MLHFNNIINKIIKFSHKSETIRLNKKKIINLLKKACIH